MTLLSDDDYFVYSPSYRRAQSAVTHKLFPQEKFAYVVREEEVSAYEHLGVRLIVIPQSAGVTNICSTRNWILDNARARWVIQADDDISKFSWIYERKYLALSVEHLDSILLSAFSMAEDLGISLWGMNILSDPINYSQIKPFSFHSPILGPFSATISVDLRYDERLTLKEDYDLFLQVMNRDGAAMRHNYLCYAANHFTLDGGCQEYRTDTKEREQQEMLQRKWGSDIVRYNWRDLESYNMRITI